MLFDGIIIYFSYFIALYIRFSVMGGAISFPLWVSPYPQIIFIFTILVVFLYRSFKMYGSYRFKTIGSESFHIFAINGVSISFLTTFLFVTNRLHFSRLLLVFYWGISSILLILKRYLVRKILRHFRKLGYNQKHVIVIGNGHLAKQYIQDISNNPSLGITLDGYISAIKKDDLGKNLGSYEELGDILQNHDVDELIVALEPHELNFINYAIECAEKEGIRISLISLFNDYFPSHVTINNVGRTKLIDMRATPLDNFFFASIKRMIDIMGSLFGIIILSPVMLIVAIGVKLSSPGPVFFTQNRVGLNKKPFNMLKFRSMRVNDEETTGWSKDVDPRKTKFGSFIRKFSIDELPQLFNVLKGDMSLVGPRPEIPYYVRQFKEDVPLYLVRQQVRPGMTGWAQIHGLRGDTSIEDRVKYDIWYIENWSLWLDVKILFKTVFGGIINNEVIIRKEDEK